MRDNNKIQVIYKKGSWHSKNDDELFLDGALAELTITDENLRLSKEQARKMKALKRIQVFEEDTELMVTMKRTASIEKLAKEYAEEVEIGKHAFFNQRFVPSSYIFIKIILSKSERQEIAGINCIKAGGWFKFERNTIGSFVCGKIVLPKSLNLKQPKSLNHAYTLLSEVFEASRLSHTGNIYKSVFYKESDGLWYQLDNIRLSHKATPGTIARKFWDELRAELDRD